jgi:hypothetical protein
MLLSGGCGTIISGSSQQIGVRANPPGAKIEVVQTGQSSPSGILILQRDKDYVLRVAAPGYEMTSVALTRSIRGGVLVADILLFPIGIIVDAVTGGWYELNPPVVEVALRPQAPAPGISGKSAPSPAPVRVSFRSEARDRVSYVVASKIPDVRVTVEPR